MASQHVYTARTLLPIATPPVDDGALLVQEGRIVAVGPRADIRRLAPGAPVTDFGDAVLLPPHVNAHTHLELTAFPDWATNVGETAPPASFVDWILRVIRIKRSAPLEAFAPSLAEGVRRCLAAGTGAVGDILSHFPARDAYRRCPLLGRVYLEVLGRDPLQWQPLLERVEGILDEEPPGPLAYGLSPHSPYTLDRQLLEEVLALGRRRELPVAVHVAESQAETAFLADGSGPLAEHLYPRVGWGDRLPAAPGLSPIAYLERCGRLGPGTLLVHGVQVDQEDIDRIAASGASVVLCPRSNACLGVGRAPVKAYLAAGVNLALGTDSLASNDSLSLWDELAFACDWFGPALTPRRAVAMATLGGARALGLAGELGTLGAGRGAHFQVLKPTSPPAPGELYDYLASGCGADLGHLFLHGRDVLPKSR